MDRAALVTPLHAMCGAIWAFWGLAVARLQLYIFIRPPSLSLERIRQLRSFFPFPKDHY